LSFSRRGGNGISQRRAFPVERAAARQAAGDRVGRAAKRGQLRHIEVVDLRPDRHAQRAHI
jgi:hypothetical protein